MKHLHVQTLVVLLMAGCAPQPGPYAMTTFWQVDCTNPVAPANVYTSQGRLNVGPGNPVTFLTGVTITGNVAQDAVAVGNTTLEPANRNHGVVSQQVVTYKLSRSLGAAPKQYVTGKTVPLTGNTSVVAQLISPELGDLLVNGLTAAPDLSDTVDITATLEFRGTFSGDGHAFTTGTIDFPITAYKTGDCPTAFDAFTADGGVDPSVLCYYPGQVNTKSNIVCQ